MRIPLNEFEQLIDEKILKRGLSYFKGGAITDFSEISKDRGCAFSTRDCAGALFLDFCKSRVRDLA